MDERKKEIVESIVKSGYTKCSSKKNSDLFTFANFSSKYNILNVKKLF